MGAADDFLDGKTSADAFLDAAPARQSSVADNLRRIDAERIEPTEEPSTFSYLFNRLKKGAAGFMGIPGDIIGAIQAGSKPYGGSTKAAHRA